MLKIKWMETICVSLDILSYVSQCKIEYLEQLSFGDKAHAQISDVQTTVLYLPIS